MSNIQELMTALILAPRATQRSRFIVTITPRGGAPIRLEIKARSQAHARIRAFNAAKARYERFSFSVRPY